jgi:hypothetical protein
MVDSGIRQTGRPAVFSQMNARQPPSLRSIY